MPHSARKLLLDISLSCQEIMKFTEGKDYEDFREDRMMQLAIEGDLKLLEKPYTGLKRSKKKS